MAINSVSSVISSQLDSTAHGPAGTSTISGGISWEAVSGKLSSLLTRQVPTDSHASKTAQLSELMKLQMQVSSYHMRIELLSKVSDSALTTMRKLQQNQ